MSSLPQILGKRGHSLSWLTGISNPYIRVTLTSRDLHDESSSELASQILNLPLNPECQLEGITKEELEDCFLKFVVLDFDRFSRSEFVAEVVVILGELEGLSNGVTICKDLVPQPEVMVGEMYPCVFVDGWKLVKFLCVYTKPLKFVNERRARVR